MAVFLLPCFFAISGYLIPICIDRSTLSIYLKNRTERMVLTLIVAVMFWTLLSGPVSTSLPLPNHAVSAKFLSFPGHGLLFPVGSDLPEIFMQNPIST